MCVRVCGVECVGCVCRHVCVGVCVRVCACMCISNVCIVCVYWSHHVCMYMLQIACNMVCASVCQISFPPSLSFSSLSHASQLTSSKCTSI